VALSVTVISCLKASYRGREALSRRRAITLECLARRGAAGTFVKFRAASLHASDNLASRGLTGTARPLYSAGFATPAFAPMRDAPLWRNW
jgi:hypothetical protein